MSSSAYPVIWAMKHAPVTDIYERAILFVLADHGDHDGCYCYPSIPTMAEVAMCDTDTVKHRLKVMLKRGLIRKHQGPPPVSWTKFRADRRPQVYELMIPYSWFSPDQRDEVDRKLRARRADFGDDVNSQPLSPENRPDIAPPSSTGRKVRSDKGVKNPRRSPKKNGGGHGGEDSRNGGNEVRPNGGGYETSSHDANQPNTPGSKDMTSENNHEGVSYTPRSDINHGGYKKDGTGAIREPNGGVSYSPNPPIDPLELNPPKTRSLVDDPPAEGGGVSEDGGAVSDARSESDGFSPDDIRQHAKDAQELSETDVATMARRAGEVLAWGFERDQVAALVARARKGSTVRDFLARTATPEDAAAALDKVTDAPGQRDDVERVCEYLASTVEQLGFSRPVVTQEWRRSARLLLDKDHALQFKVDEAAVVRIIDWVAEHPFWGVRGNVRSMPKLRQKFETLAAQKRDSGSQGRSGSGRGSAPRRPYRDADMYPGRVSTAQEYIDADPDNPDPFPNKPIVPNGSTNGEAGSSTSSRSNDGGDPNEVVPPTRRPMTAEELAEADPFPNKPISPGEAA